jgi:hypothetical protein
MMGMGDGGSTSPPSAGGARACGRGANGRARGGRAGGRAGGAEGRAGGRAGRERAGGLPRGPAAMDWILHGQVRMGGVIRASRSREAGAGPPTLPALTQAPARRRVPAGLAAGRGTPIFRGIALGCRIECTVLPQRHLGGEEACYCRKGFFGREGGLAQEETSGSVGKIWKAGRFGSSRFVGKIALWARQGS